MIIEQKNFVKYVRTKMYLSLKYRGFENQFKPIHIPTKEISERFFPFPQYNYKNEVKTLCELGEIKITKLGKAYYYEALKPGGFDLNLLPNNNIPNDKVTQAMLNYIQRVSLPNNAPSTPYFDLFLKYRNAKPKLFFKVDNFCGRVHTPISSFHRTHRPYILLENENTTGLDVATMQPLILGKILNEAIGTNDLSDLVNSGHDIYIEFQNKHHLESRDLAKQKFFEMLYSKPSNALKRLFEGANWINWINEYKQLELPENPHNKDKPYSNLAWLLQTNEVKIMRKVWEQLVIYNMPFLSVHDEIIVKQTDYQNAKAIFESVLSKEFKYFKLNTKDAISEPGSVELNKQLVTSENEKLPFTDSNQTSPKIDFKPFKKEFNPLWDIKELQTGFKALQVPKQPIKINQYSIITNVKNFVDSHFEIIKHNNGNPTFLPYYTRLKELKQHIRAE
jgi:hypothetical protein